MKGVFRIREASLADVPVLAEYNLRLAWETEHRRLNPGTVLKGVEALIRDRSKGEYFVAETVPGTELAQAPDGVAGEDGLRAAGVIGQSCVTYEWSDWRNGNVWWFQSVYVEATWRGSGVFRALFEHVRAEAEARGVVALRLYVEAENENAQQVYRRRGMNPTSYRVYEREL